MDETDGRKILIMYATTLDENEWPLLWLDAWTQMDDVCSTSFWPLFYRSLFERYLIYENKTDKLSNMMASWPVVVEL